MTKNILIINTANYDSDWLEYFDGLSAKNLNLLLLASDPKLISHFRVKSWGASEYKAFLRPDSKQIFAILFTLLRPISFFYAFIVMLYYKFSKKVESVLCFSTYEKLHFSFAAKLIGLKVVWIINPGYDFQVPALSRFFLNFLSKYANTVCLTENCQKIISSKKLNIKNSEAIKIGISDRYYQEQKSIFQSLADKTAQKSDKKYFTIGTIQDLSGDVSHIEVLFHALKKCMEVIPEIQLIVAGDGPERKRLSWMARKMEIGNLIWFVGNHKNPQKWLANFDLYISSCPTPKLKDLNTILYAASNSLPIIAPIDCGFEEFINNKESGILLDIFNSEDLARAIIELEQNTFKRENIGKNGQKFISANFKLTNTIDNLYNAIKR